MNRGTRTRNAFSFGVLVAHVTQRLNHSHLT